MARRLRTLLAVVLVADFFTVAIALATLSLWPYFPTCLYVLCYIGLGGKYGSQVLTLGSDLDYASSIALAVNVLCVLALIYFVVRILLVFYVDPKYLPFKTGLAMVCIGSMSLVCIFLGMDNRSSYLAISVRQSVFHNVFGISVLFIAAQACFSELICQLLIWLGIAGSTQVAT